MKLSLLIKPASSACPGKCVYCFYKDSAKKRLVADRGIMDKDLLFRLLREARSISSELSVSFQGGEPLLAGERFFFDTLSYIKELGGDTYVSVQTSGYGMTESIARLFAHRGVSVGLSIDGRAPLHDRYRGKGSHGAALSALKLLQGAGCDVSVLTVVTRDTAKRAAAVYDYISSLGVSYMQFIPCMETDGAEHCVMTGGEYFTFLCDLFDVWYKDLCKGSAVGIRLFDNFIMKSKNMMPEACGSMGICGSYLTVESDGSVYPCDFYCTDGHLLGIYPEASLKELLGSSLASSFVSESFELSEDCKKCEFYRLCRGECKKMRKDGKFIYCDAYRRFFERYAGKLARI